MLRSLWSGVSGLRTHQTRMDVIGNDIANVNTTGYKQSDVTFKEQLVNTIRPPSTGASGLQVGMGVQLGSIARNFSDGVLTETQRSSNMAVAGDGFFVVADSVAGGSKYFTRAGDFLPGVNSATGETYFINSGGKRLQGIMDANPDSTGQTSATLVDIVLPAGTTDYDDCERRENLGQHRRRDCRWSSGWCLWPASRTTTAYPAPAATCSAVR